MSLFIPLRRLFWCVAIGSLPLLGAPPAPGTPAQPLVDVAVGDVRLTVVAAKPGGLQETYLARDATGAWVPVARAFLPGFTGAAAENRFFDTRMTPYRYAAEEIVSAASVERSGDGTTVVVHLRGARAGRVEINKTITLRKASPWVDVEVAAALAEPELDYLRSSLTFLPDGPPDFVHAPTTKQDDPRSGPGRDQVIGDHAFHEPALILQKGATALALVPRLDLINRDKVLSPDARTVQRVPRNKFSVPIEPQNNSMPTALDLDVVSGLSAQPVLTYGIMDFVVGHHIRYQRTNTDAMIRHLDQTSLHFGYSLLVTARAVPRRAYESVSRFLWARYGAKEFADIASPQVDMPLPDYVRLVYGVVSKPMDPAVQPPVPGYPDHGVFLDFELNGTPVGGMVTPLGVLGFGDALWNSEFWNDVRDAPGMRWWGQRLAIPALVDRARRIVNLALLAPQNSRGFFPLIYHARDRRWSPSALGPGPHGGYTLFAHDQVWWSVPGMSKTAACLANYYDWCERDPRILQYLSRYADGLVRLLPADGALPSYFDATLQPVPVLARSAQPAASLWFLARMATLTGRADYRAAAQRIADYLRREVLPQQRWVDLEPYLSCGQNPLSFTQDHEEGLPVRGNLSAIWAAEGFLALNEATGDAADLADGEAVLDYLAFSQAAWRPHYIYTANPFGGFTADNVDTATWLDARQCEAVHPFIAYGLRLGREDLLQRGVAAARAGLVLINSPRQRANGIYRHPNLYGTGLGPENINHEGHNQSAMRTHPSWGECSAIFTGLASATRMLDGGYVDLDRSLVVPVEPVTLSIHPAHAGAPATITTTSALARLPLPWSDPFAVGLRITQHGEVSERVVHVSATPVTITAK